MHARIRICKCMRSNVIEPGKERDKERVRGQTGNGKCGGRRLRKRIWVKG